MTDKRKHHGSSLDDFLRGEGVLDEFEAIARAEVISVLPYPMTPPSPEYMRYLKWRARREHQR